VTYTQVFCSGCVMTWPEEDFDPIAHAEERHGGEDPGHTTQSWDNMVAAMEQSSSTPTADLFEFREAYEDDDNIWWRIDCGHHMNLMDAAFEEIDRLREQVARHEH
jgi:hypothetical protein